MVLSKSDTTTIKGIAILLMFWHHLFLNSSQYEGFTQQFASVSKVCVALFLFVSGYGLAKQYSSFGERGFKTTLLFLLRRFTKFFLTYWFCFAIVILIGCLFGYSLHDAYPVTRNTLKCFTLDAWGQMGYNSYLPSWWFNKMILQLYIVFPIFYFIAWNKWTSLLGVFAICLAQLYAKSIPGNIFFFVEGGLPAFYLGIVLSLHTFIPTALNKRSRIIMAILSLLLIAGLSILHNRIILTDAYQAILVRALIALCIVFAYRMSVIPQYPIISFIGKYATIMYLTHVLIIKLIPSIVYFPHYSLLVFLLFAIICLAFAMIIDSLDKALHYDKLKMSLVELIDRF